MALLLRRVPSIGTAYCISDFWDAATRRRIAADDLEENLNMVASEVVERVLSELFRARKVDFRQYRRAFLERRLMHRALLIGARDEFEYLDLLLADKGEVERLADGLMINVGCFFRNRLVFELIERQLAPSIMRQRKEQGRFELRALSAGCSMGEEAYSLAITLHKACKKKQIPWKIKIFATDVDEDALAVARKGVYRKEALLNVTLCELEEYFSKDGDKYLISEELRASVCFFSHDLFGDVPIASADNDGGKMDLVLCCNVLIYCAREAQSALLNRLRDVMDKDAYLVLGEAEGIDESIYSKFVSWDVNSRIFKKG
jgi:chemotaxis methyl-accepting protein methylase